ncbi:uncharacterized protein [Spinacia oleracea]|uniref:Uncharacterized protein n=1 Tax=Spinacia oleracea TaxID=3562 RepID=A0A9R0HT31_SPIOL|nr:uncharacterized protein LOC110775907 [Spinacia oleracea]
MEVIHGSASQVNADSTMDRVSFEDKGVVDVPAWLSEVYTEDILKAVEAKKKESSKKSDKGASGDVAKEPTSSATMKRPASSTVALKPKRPFFKKMGTADAAAKPSVSKPSTPPAGGEVLLNQASIPPPENKEVSPQVDTEGDSAARAAADEVAAEQAEAAGATTSSKEDKGKGKEAEAPSTDNAFMPPSALPIVEMFKRMRRAEVASIPPSDGFSSEVKDKILSDVYAAISEEYVRSLPGIDLGFFGSIQSLVLDLFIRCAESRNYHFDMHNEMLKHKDQIENHEQYAEKTAGLINLDADKKIKSETEDLRKVEEDAQNYKRKLLEHEERLAVLRKEYSSVSERVTNFSSKVNVLEGQLKAMQGEIEAVRKETASSFKLGKESILESAQRAWDQSMDGKDFSWFKRRISYQVAVSTARRLGLDPPEFVSDGEEDMEEEEVNSPEGQDVQDGSFIAPHP